MWGRVGGGGGAQTDLGRPHSPKPLPRCFSSGSRWKAPSVREIFSGKRDLSAREEPGAGKGVR